MKLCIWCLSPSVAFHDIHAPAHSVILASGTLAPLDALSESLNATFPQRLEAPHCANARKQLLCSAIGRGKRGSLLGTYKNTSSTKYQDDIGEVMLAHLKHVPGGCLCFVPSYSLLNKFVDRWKETGLWKQFVNMRSCFVENSQIPVGDIFRRYSTAALSSSGNGALLFCVFRGRFSEGINFSDELARAVIVIGVPFPSMADVKLQLIKDSLTGRHQQRFYSSLAYQAVNQAIGRVIRHKDDYGCVLLLDSRYCEDQGRRSLSKWLRPFVQVLTGVTESIWQTRQFFQNIEKQKRDLLHAIQNQMNQNHTTGGVVGATEKKGNTQLVKTNQTKKNQKKKVKKKKVKKVKRSKNDDSSDDDFEKPVKRRKKIYKK